MTKLPSSPITVNSFPSHFSVFFSSLSLLLSSSSILIIHFTEATISTSVAIIAAVIVFAIPV